MSAQLDPIVGRYIYLRLQGREHRVYFEEAGTGIPLLCLHTAGADGRQFRYMMNDPAITDHFRVVSFDLPWHGKSTPPDGWQDEEYRLTTDAYIEAIRSFRDALGLERPVVLGCSIGGRVVLSLAIRHAEEFRALIGLEAAAHQTPWYDREWLQSARRSRRRSLRRTGLRPDRATEPRFHPPGNTVAYTCRAVPAYSKAISIFIGSTAICATRSAKSIRAFVRSI